MFQKLINARYCKINTTGWVGCQCNCVIPLLMLRSLHPIELALLQTRENARTSSESQTQVKSPSPVSLLNKRNRAGHTSFIRMRILSDCKLDYFELKPFLWTFKTEFFTLHNYDWYRWKMQNSTSNCTMKEKVHLCLS